MIFLKNGFEYQIYNATGQYVFGGKNNIGNKINIADLLSGIIFYKNKNRK